METLLQKPGKVVVQYDTSDHKIYFNLDSGGVRGTLVVTKNNDGRTAMHVYKDTAFSLKGR